MLVASNKTTNEEHTAQNIAAWADVKAGLVTASCRVVWHWNTVVLHHIMYLDIDWPKNTNFSLKKHQGKLCVTVLVGCVSIGAHHAVKKQLGSGIQHQASATAVYMGSKSSPGEGWGF